MVGHFKGDTWTLDAIERGDIASIKAKVASDPGYLTSRDFVGNTPLLMALDCNHMELVRFLLDNKADPNCEVDDGETALIKAVTSDHKDSVEITRLLLEAGARVSPDEATGISPLHRAAVRGHVEHARLLLENGADVNERTVIDGEETALMEAAFLGHAAMVRFLLEKGADPSIRNYVTNLSPIEIAAAARKGPDPAVEAVLNQEMVEDAKEYLSKDIEVNPEVREPLLNMMDGIDMKKAYRENAEQIAREGNHQEVIDILREWERSHPSC